MSTYPTEPRVCCQCFLLRTINEFPKNQIRGKNINESKCLYCTSSVTLRMCSTCYKPKKNFTKDEWHKPIDQPAECRDCNPRVCGMCKKLKTIDEFSKTQWRNFAPYSEELQKETAGRETSLKNVYSKCIECLNSLEYQELNNQRSNDNNNSYLNSLAYQEQHSTDNRSSYSAPFASKRQAFATPSKSLVKVSFSYIKFNICNPL